MSKSKHAPEFRAMVAKEYIDGAGSSYELAEKYHVGRATLQKWVALFREQGDYSAVRIPSIRTMIPAIHCSSSAF